MMVKYYNMSTLGFPKTIYRVNTWDNACVDSLTSRGGQCIHHTVCSSCLSSSSSLLSLNRSTSPTSSPRCVLLLLCKALPGYREGESTDINTGEAPCSVCHYEAVAQSAPLPCVSPHCSLVFGVTQKLGTWIRRMMVAHVTNTFNSHMWFWQVFFLVLQSLCVV